MGELIPDQVTGAPEPAAVVPNRVVPEPATLEPAIPEPAIPEPPQTGDPAVDQALGAVAAAARGPLEQQLAVYEAAHRTLQDRLADVEG